MNEFRESDWKVLRELKTVALERLCQRILHQVGRDIDDERRSYFERFKRVHSMMDEGNDKLARAFDDLRRSNAFMHLFEMRCQKLITDNELSRFSVELQTRIFYLEKEGRLTSARAAGADGKEGTQ